MKRAFPIALLLAAALAAGPAAAQARTAKKGDTIRLGNGKEVATLDDIEGNVLVSLESGLASVEGTSRVGEGARVITTANAKALVKFDDGCEVSLKPNQRLEIDAERPCKERIARAHSVLLEPGGMALAGGSGAAAAVLAGTAGASVGLGAATALGVTGVAALLHDRKSVSPN